MSALAGGDSAGFSNGVGLEALFNSPQGLATSLAQPSVVYVCDSVNKAIRAVSITDGTR